MSVWLNSICSCNEEENFSLENCKINDSEINERVLCSELCKLVDKSKR